ncbi:ABC-2 type transport system permease protein [Streptomyces sp. SceaMP-e96]|uniref:ABC transporter permease n=1 Tax=unclassified Streptomyces TaxID=2593676 RepID=UPI0008238306|nr:MULTISPECIES: ABC transporter permease [unclassified Streptomyces]MYT15710.1 ABC transporter permease [Streptomyces sp. SID4951]SCK24034.1 ABC-2 type transport system permease protein [Streptomyces sp. SceaMP-e96]
MISPTTRELALLHARELVRDPKYFYFALFFPFGMLGIFLGIGSVMPKEAGAPDFLQLVIPMAIFLAVTSAALTVTAGPLATLRAKGTLRLLGTTPVGRARLVFTHMLARLVMVTTQAAVLLALAVALGKVEPGRLPALFGIALLGLAMFGGIGYLIGGRLSSPDAAANVGTLVQLAALFLSGLAFPLELMPEAVRTTLSLLPTSFFADLMRTQMSQGNATHPLWLSLLVVTATAAGAVFLAVRTFKWDQGEIG